MGRTLQIPCARAYQPLLQPSRYKGLHGGRGSGKSHELASLLVERFTLQPNTRWVCIREVQKSLDQSVKQLIEDKIKEYQLSDNFIIKHTHIETPHDGMLIFQGMQDHTADSIKSLEGYDGAWVEEAQTLSDRSLTLLRPTIRKDDSEIWFSWNPENDSDPVDKLLRGANVPPDSIVIGTTFRDNPWFPAVLQKEMEWDRRVDFEKYQHVWEGGYEKRSDRRVFKNWRIEEFTPPATAQWKLGSDWGFSVDPSTLLRCYEERVNPATQQEWPRKRLYVDRELFQIGVEIDYLPAFFDGLVCGCAIGPTGERLAPCVNPQLHGWARHQPIVADSSRPDTISFLRRHGYGGMEPAKKGQNSVKEGVLFLQGYEIIVHPRCTHTIDEFKNYSFVVDKQTGKVTNEIEDRKNHIIDPMRYALEQLRGALRVRKAVWG
jgi:phage terminase large subunit